MERSPLARRGALLAAAALAACSHAPASCPPAGPTVTAAGVSVADSCGRSSLALLPRVRIGGEWLGSGCEATDGVWCAAGDYGRVGALVVDGELVVSFVAAQDAVVEGLALEGPLELPGASAWLSNGFQSWSPSGVIAIGPPPTDDALAPALTARGDDELFREGSELSWWYTFAGGGDLALVAGALDATRFKPWTQVVRDVDGTRVRLAAGGAGEQVAVAAGEELRGDPWRVEVGTGLEAMLERYAAGLPSRARDRAAPAEAGWNSWYELWDAVDEEAVRANAPLARQALQPLLPPGAPLRIVVDDGWEAGWGDWQPNAKFPSGLDGLAADLRADGFEMGVWLAPLLVQESQPLVTDHPDWFVADAVYPHLKNGRMRVLDVTNPDAAAHLADTIARIVSWGYGLLKIDFLFAGTYEGGRYEAVTGLEAYHRALTIIRQAAGDDVVLLTVGAPPLPSFHYAEAWRVGGDIALEAFGPSWFFAVDQARNVGARWPLCLAVRCDADPPILRELTRDEVGFGVWTVALSGGALFLSDDLRALPAERLTWLGADAATAAVSGAPARPEDPFPAEPPATLALSSVDFVTQQNHHVVPARWRLPDGRLVVLNTSEAPVTIGGVTVPARGAAAAP